jgi:hypothetical protein
MEETPRPSGEAGRLGCAYLHRTLLARAAGRPDRRSEQLDLAPAEVKSSTAETSNVTAPKQLPLTFSATNDGRIVLEAGTAGLEWFRVGLTQALQQRYQVRSGYLTECS